MDLTPASREYIVRYVGTSMFIQPLPLPVLQKKMMIWWGPILNEVLLLVTPWPLHISSAACV